MCTIRVFALILWSATLIEDCVEECASLSAAEKRPTTVLLMICSIHLG